MYFKMYVFQNIRQRDLKADFPEAKKKKSTFAAQKGDKQTKQKKDL